MVSLFNLFLHNITIIIIIIFITSHIFAKRTARLLFKNISITPEYWMSFFKLLKRLAKVVNNFV